MLLNILEKRKNFIIATICAVTLHVLFISIELSLNPTQQNLTLDTLSVVLQQDQKKAEIIEEEIVSTKPVKERVSEDTTPVVETFRQPEPSVKERAEDIETPDDLETVLTTQKTINSVEFKQWMRAETNSYIDSNPASLETFSKSFEIPVEEQGPVVDKDINSLASGLYTTKTNGKIRCHSQAVLPFNDDLAPNTISVSKDCTPNKKFELNIK